MKIGPREVVAGAIISVLVLFVVLLIENRGDECCPGCISAIQSCKASIDIPKLPDYSYRHKKEDEYHPIPEPSSIALFGIGGGAILASRIRAGLKA